MKLCGAFTTLIAFATLVCTGFSSAVAGGDLANISTGARQSRRQGRSRYWGSYHVLGLRIVEAGKKNGKVGPKLHDKMEVCPTLFKRGFSIECTNVVGKRTKVTWRINRWHYRSERRYPYMINGDRKGKAFRFHWYYLQRYTARNFLTIRCQDRRRRQYGQVRVRFTERACAQRTTSPPTTTRPSTTVESTSIAQTTEGRTTAGTTTKADNSAGTTTPAAATSAATTGPRSTIGGTTVIGTTLSASSAAETTSAVSTSETITTGTTAIAPTTIAGTSIAETTASSSTADATTVAGTTVAGTTVPVTTVATSTAGATTAAGTTVPVTTVPVTTIPGTTAAVSSAEASTTVAGTTVAETTVPVTTVATSTADATTVAGTTVAGTTVPVTTVATSTADATTVAGTTVAGTTVPVTTAATSTAVGTTVASTTAAGTTAPVTTVATSTADATTVAGTTVAGTTVPVTTVATSTADATTVAGTTIAETTIPVTTVATSTAESTTATATTAAVTTAAATTVPETTTAPVTTVATSTADATTVAGTTIAETTAPVTAATTSTAELTTAATTTVATTTAAATTVAATTAAATTAAATTAAATTAAATTVAATTAAATTAAATTAATTTAAATTAAATTAAATTAATTTAAATTVAATTAAVTTAAATTVAATTAAETTVPETTVTTSTTEATTAATTTVAATTAEVTTVITTTTAADICNVACTGGNQNNRQGSCMPGWQCRRRGGRRICVGQPCCPDSQIFNPGNGRCRPVTTAVPTTVEVTTSTTTTAPTSAPATTTAATTTAEQTTRPRACQPRTRQSVAVLTDRQWQDISDGILRMKSLPASNPLSFDSFVDLHNSQEHHWHRGSYFLPSHRNLLFEFEEALRHPNGGNCANCAIPFWDWSTRSNGQWPYDPAWPKMGGGNGGPIPLAPFVGFRANLPANNPHNVFRYFIHNADQWPIPGFGMWDADWFETSANIEGAINAPPEGNPFEAFSAYWEQAHGTPHVGIGGDMEDPFFSPNDFMFYFHHCMVDRVWWQWQQARRNVGRQNDFGGQHYEPPVDVSITETLRPVSWGRSTRDVFNYIDSCVSYDIPADAAQVTSRSLQLDDDMLSSMRNSSVRQGGQSGQGSRTYRSEQETSNVETVAAITKSTRPEQYKKACEYVSKSKKSLARAARKMSLPQRMKNIASTYRRTIATKALRLSEEDFEHPDSVLAQSNTDIQKDGEKDLRKALSEGGRLESGI